MHLPASGVEPSMVRIAFSPAAAVIALKLLTDVSNSTKTLWVVFRSIEGTICGVCCVITIDPISHLRLIPHKENETIRDSCLSTFSSSLSART